MIVLLHNAPAYGAVERYVETIACALGAECVLVHPGVEELERVDVRTVVLERPTTPRLVRLLRSLSPVLVHVTDVWPQAVLAARLARVPRVLVTHHTPELPRRDNLAGRAWWRLGWAMKPEVLYTSNGDRDRDARRPSHVVPLGVDVDRFAAGRAALPKTGPLVGNVARLAPQKDQRTLIEAMARVCRALPGTRLALVGDGELRAELEGLTERLGLQGAVEFAGWRDDIPDVLASLDVFAYPSRFEGFCLAVVEAQAAGVPVVTTPVGALRETVVDGVTGLHVAPGDPVELADAILRLLSDRALAGRLAAEAQRRVRERFSDQRMIEGTLRVYGLPAG